MNPTPTTSARSAAWPVLLLALLLGLLLALPLAACRERGDENAGPRTGSIVARVHWPPEALRAATAQPGRSTPQVAPDGVVTVRGIISAADMATIQQDFSATPGEAGSGAIANVPAGADRTLTLQGIDPAGTIVYEGQTTGITVAAGQANDAGTVNMFPAGPLASRWGVMIWGRGTWKATP